MLRKLTLVAFVVTLFVVATLAVEAEKKEDSIAAKDTKDLDQSASHGWGWGWPTSYVHRLQHYGWGGWGHQGWGWGHQGGHQGHHGHGHHHQHGWGWPVHHGWGH